MDSKYNPAEVESKIYAMWENGGYFTPKIDKSKKPFTILLPPPNASGKMHTGNVLMIAVEDLLIRWRRMKGEPTLWLPGTDHAGTETQITFERELKKQDKSRFIYDRQTLYNMIWDFVMNNKGQIEDQIRHMGASVDWSRAKFTLDPEIVSTVRATFQKMAADGLVYRDDYIVNYCPVCGTTYADIEVENIERLDPFYYIKYGPFTIGTVRPETKFRDTALAVNPKDKRYKSSIGKTLEIPGLLGPLTMTVIADPEVDPKFGTGIMKVTPAHDPHDYDLGKKYHLPVTPIIDLQGRMDFSWFLVKNNLAEKYRLRAEKYHRKKITEARKLIVEDLREDGLLEKVDDQYSHSVKICKAGHDIEPTILPNWFIKVEALKKPALDVVKKKQIKIYPGWREITYVRWMEIMHDWAISRQNVWGIRIPAWYDVKENQNISVDFLSKSGERKSGTISELRASYSLEEIESGLQTLRTPKDSKYVISETKPGPDFLQETDTFDTWFSSGQWPLVTLGFPNSADFQYFYPTSVLETGWEIVTKWVSRMIMFGIYLTGKAPFEFVYLHGLVRALDGRKMSKSLGNIINPEDYMRDYGVDALRMGLISGTAGGKDFNFPKDKVIAYRNFANKLWNIGRFILLSLEAQNISMDEQLPTNLTKEDKAVIKKLNALIKKVGTNLEKFRFAQASELIYHFVWHELADKYVEDSKIKINSESVDQKEKLATLSVLNHVYLICLKLLHPFMPFVTEEIWQLFEPYRNEKTPLIISSWPTSK